jgi:hypothetical protein
MGEVAGGGAESRAVIFSTDAGIGRTKMGLNLPTKRRCEQEK